MKKIRLLSLLCTALILCMIVTSGFGCDIIIPIFGAPEESVSETSMPPEAIAELTPLQEEFEQFTKDFLLGSLSGMFDVKYFLEDPEGFGISDEDRDPSWGNYEPMTKRDLKDIRDFTDSLSAYFVRDELTADQQMVLDLILYRYGSFDQYADVFYYQEPLEPGDGEHVYVPLLMTMCTLENEADIENYIILLEDIPKYFDSILEFEKEKADQGLFMLDSNLKEVQKELNAFAKLKKNNLLVAYFADSIEDIKSLSESDREDYVKQVEDIVLKKVLPAYTNLSKEIGKLKGKGKYKDGLSSMPKGKEYIEYELYGMGFTDDPKDMIKKLDDLVESTVKDFRNNAAPSGSNPDFDGNTGEDLFEYLQEQAENEFPRLPEGINCIIASVDPSLEDSARPAMYFRPKLDAIEDNVIMVNNKYVKNIKEGDSYSLSVFAHEGFPGHMLQFTTIYSQDINDLRKLWSYTGNAEGWAIYAEHYAYKYFPGSRKDNDEDRFYSVLSLILWGRLEMGVNYEGWDQTEVGDFLEWMYGKKFPKKEITEIRNGIMAAPLSTAPYALGYQQIVELRERYSHVSDLEFHTAFLQAGSIPFSIMRDHLDELFASAGNEATETTKTNRAIKAA